MPDTFVRVRAVRLEALISLTMEQQEEIARLRACLADARRELDREREARHTAQLRAGRASERVYALEHAGEAA